MGKDDMAKGTEEKLKGARDRIDAIDDKILLLLNERAGEVLEVGRVKSNDNADFYVPSREREIYERLTGANKGPFPDKALRNVFREIISASLSMEKPQRIAFLGPVATYTHGASMRHFGLSGEFIPKKDIADVFEDVERGKADFGVVPIENTTEGVVTHTLDLFVKSDLKISAEINLEVSLSIMNKSGKAGDVKKVASHPNPLGQSKYYLKEKFPDAQIIDMASTALAAKEASEDESVAAIASDAAATLYDLRIIESKIEDNSNNYTRFLVIGTKESGKTGSDKTSIVFGLNDRPGALFEMLKSFAGRKCNLTKIESRPLKTKAWEYVFFIDLDGHIEDENIREAVKEIKDQTSFMKVLGSYPKALKSEVNL